MIRQSTRDRIKNEHRQIEHCIKLFERGMLTHDETILTIIAIINGERNIEGKRELSRHLTCKLST